MPVNDKNEQYISCPKMGEMRYNNNCGYIYF